MKNTEVQPSAYDKRVGELYRMNKGALAHRWREVNPNCVWTAAPPERWSKDELISGILEAERPARATAIEHGAVPSTWFGVGMWPTCKCGYAPRDNGRLTAHWREHGVEVVDDHRHLVERPVAS